MTPHRRSHEAWKASAILIALAFLQFTPSPLQGQQVRDQESWGVLTMPGDGAAPAAELRTFVGRVVGWLASTPEGPWARLGAGLRDPAAEPSAWLILQDSQGSITPSDLREPSTPLAQAFAFDLALDLNRLRALSPEPFSRSPRGLALDALGIDNARRVRLSAVAAVSDGSDDLTVLLFAESRSHAPGRWLPLPIAEVRPAPSRIPGGAALELDFEDRLPGLLLAAAGVALASDGSGHAISSDELLSDWGDAGAGAILGLGRAAEGRIWCWAEGDSLIGAIPLRRGADDRTTAAQLRAVLGPRLNWRRDDTGRAFAEVALGDPRHDAGRRLWLRLVTIRDRSVLVLATSEPALDACTPTLAGLVP